MRYQPCRFSAGASSVVLALGLAVLAVGGGPAVAEPPVITAIDPQSAHPRGWGTITGDQFTYTPGGAVRYTPVGGVAMDWEVLQWLHGEVTFRIPANTPLGSGQVKAVRYDGEESNSVAFQVTASPVVHVDVANTGYEDGSAAHPYNTIQEGLDAANPGDIVLVHPGLYHEALITMRPDVILQGSGAGSTVVDGNTTDPVFQLPSGIAYNPTTTILDLTIRNGSNGIKVAWGGERPYLTLERVVIRESASHGMDLPTLSPNSHVALSDCELAHNAQAGLNVVGNSLDRTMQVWLTDTELHHNGAEGIRGYSSGGQLYLYTTRCHVHHNTADGIYIGSYWNQDIFLESQGSRWVDNGASGVRLWAYINDAIASATLTGDTMSRNATHGFHVDTPEDGRQILRGTICRSTAVGNGGHGLSVCVRGGFSRGYFTWENLLVAHNQGGGVAFATAGEYSTVYGRLDATVDRATIADNGPVGLGRNIWDTHVDIANSIITGHNDDLVEMDAANVRYCNIGDGTHAGVNANISLNSLFANATGGDYHLQSVSGRYNPTTGTWVADAVHSPCIDAGDPASTYTDEPAPNGLRLNMGAYAGTNEASKSMPPAITQIQPGSGPRGTQGIITGTRFGATEGTVKFTPSAGGTTNWDVLGWTNTAIAFRVAATTPIGGGEVEAVRADTGQSNQVTFTVTDPWIVLVDDSNATGVENGSAPYPFSTIREGIDAVRANGTVSVARGAYTQGLTVVAKRVTIKGGYMGGTYPGTGDFSEATRNPATHPTILDGGGAATQVVCPDAAAKGSVLDGLTIRNGGAILRGGLVLRRVIAKSATP